MQFHWYGRLSGVCIHFICGGIKRQSVLRTTKKLVADLIFLNEEQKIIVKSDIKLVFTNKKHEFDPLFISAQSCDINFSEEEYRITAH